MPGLTGLRKVVVGLVLRAPDDDGHHRRRTRPRRPRSGEPGVLALRAALGVADPGVPPVSSPGQGSGCTLHLWRSIRSDLIRMPPCRELSALLFGWRVVAGRPLRALPPLMRVPGASVNHEQKCSELGKPDRSGPISAAIVSAVSTPTVPGTAEVHEALTRRPVQPRQRPAPGPPPPDGRRANRGGESDRHGPAVSESPRLRDGDRVLADPRVRSGRRRARTASRPVSARSPAGLTPALHTYGRSPAGSHQFPALKEKQTDTDLMISAHAVPGDCHYHGLGDCMNNDRQWE